MLSGCRPASGVSVQAGDRVVVPSIAIAPCPRGAELSVGQMSVTVTKQVKVEEIGAEISDGGVQPEGAWRCAPGKGVFDGVYDGFVYRQSEVLGGVIVNDSVDPAAEGST